MPTLIDMRLKATWPVRPDTRQLHGLACTLFEGEGAQHTGQQKPFAVWPLRPLADGAPDEWTWRASWLPDGPVPESVAVADTLRVGHVTCVVTENSQRRATHARLADGPALSRVTVKFESPTYFSRNGSDSGYPDARLILGSWRRRWNDSLPAGSPLAVTDTDWKALHPLVTLDGQGLRTERRDTGHGRDRRGFTGPATMRLRGDVPPHLRRVFTALTRFAEFGGTGAQTTHGFGATRTTLPPGNERRP